MCGHAPESISHILSECSELAGDKYKLQYDKVGSTVHGMCCQRGGYDHSPRPGTSIATEEVNCKKADVVPPVERRRAGEQAPSLTSPLDGGVCRK